MKRSFPMMVEEFRLHWRNYVVQSVLAAGVVLLVLVSLSMRQVVIIASIGSTAFIVFAMPDSLTAQPRNVIGGQLVGLTCGSQCYLIPHTPVFAVGALAVGISIFVMVVTDTEHPPASGTALGAAITGVSWKACVAVIAGVLLMSLAHRLLEPVLRDLT